MQKIKILTLVILNAFLFGLFLFSCSKEEPIKVESTETFEMTGGDGQCYLVTLERYSDNSVSFQKKIIPCTDGFSLRVGVHISQLTNQVPSGETGENYWYISLLEDVPPAYIGPHYDIYCDCEVPGNDEGLCDEGMGHECLVDPSRLFNIICQGICCDDCDMTICVTTRTIHVGGGGILVSANKVRSLQETLSERSPITTILYGDNVQMNVVQDGNSIIITRTSNNSNSTPSKLYNLTSLSPSGGILPIPTTGKYWFVPFQIGISELRIGSGEAPHCVSDNNDPCDGDCEMQASTIHPGCLECKCVGKGDCDLELAYNMGGVFLSGEDIEIIDNQ